MVSASADLAQSLAVRRMLRWIALLGVWLASRALLVAVGVRELPFYPKGPLAFDDLEVYARWLPDLTSGVLPTDDMWQYPPATSFFFLLGQFGPDPATTLMIAIVGVDLVLTIVLAVHRLSAGWFWVLFGLMIVPLVHNRAVRLTTKRLEAATPLSMAEIQADKDQLRAEFAMAARRLEMNG